MSGVILGVISYECFIENKNGIKTLETVNPKKKEHWASSRFYWFFQKKHWINFKIRRLVNSK